MSASPSLLAPAARGAAPDLAVLDDPMEQRRFTRFEQAADGRAVAESSFQVAGMHCAACADVIEAAVGALPGVLSVRVSAAAQRALVRWDPAAAQASGLVAAIRAAGYDAVPDAAASARELRRRERRSALWRLFVASFCMMQVMMFATPGYVAGAGELAPDLRQLLNWGSWLITLPVMVFSAQPFLSGAWRSVRSRRIGMDVPVALGLLVTFVASSGATFAPGGVFGSEVYFDSLTMFLSFLLAGRFLEMLSRHRAQESLEAALSAMPETARRLRADGSIESVSVQRLVPGDRVQVPLGQAVPADGPVEVGRTHVDESLLTGESTAVPKQPGAMLVAGSVNLGAPVVMRVERVGADTRFEAIVALVRDAMTQRPALAAQADRWAGPFLWTVLVLAAAAGAAWSVLDPPRALWVVVAVLIVTCPCALSLAAPAALLAATGRLARHGVLVKRLDALETLASVDRVFVDKTGTLTEERPVICHIERQPAAPATLGEDDLVARAASLARWSSHPLAQVIAMSREGESDAGLAAWQAVQEEPGQGVSALDAQGTAWRLGRHDWVLGQARVSDEAGEAAAHPRVWFGPVGRPWCRIDFDEQLRSDAAMAVTALRGLGIKVGLLSGDAPARVEQLGARLGLDQAVGGASPEDKLDAVAGAQARGEKVAMIGDGVNDAPVLARADVSFAMGHGALVSRTHADAVVASSRLGDLVLAHVLARRTMRVVRQNLLWAAAYNAVSIPLALSGHLPPWAAGVGMATSSLGVILNSARLARQP